jgi:hypothetical protein
MFVRFNSVLLRELCRQVEETDDPNNLIELSDEISRLINEKRRRIILAKRGVLTTERIPSTVPRYTRAA